MARYRGTVLSGRSAGATFDYLAEFSNAAQWDPGVARAERLDDGPVGLGSRFRLEVLIGGRTTPLEYTTTTYERPHRVVVTAQNAFFRSEDTITVAPRTDGGSILTYRADLGLTGFAAPFGGLLTLPLRRIGDRALDGLQRVLAPAGDRAASVPGPASAPDAVRSALSVGVDELLEASVVGSFSSVGPAVRRRLSGWTRPPSMKGQVVLITGATSGLGLATAVGVGRLGATVRFVARDRRRAEQAMATVVREVPGVDVGFLLADMGELDQVRSAADQFIAGHDRLDVLVHNAGALAREHNVTSAGTEVTVASQLVAPFLLSGLILPTLESSIPSRVIQMSSGGMYTQRFDLATLEMGPADYDGAVAYAKVKRAQLVLMHEWVRRLDGSGVAFHAMHPGWADTPGLRSGLPGFAEVMSPLLRSVEAGADTAVWLASAPDGEATTAGFWLDRRRRWEHKVPWTRLDDAAFVAAGSALWAWCADRAGWDVVSPSR